MTATHCSLCSLAADHPGVALGADGVCNLCRLDAGVDLITAFNYTNAVYDEFVATPPDPDRKYDCLFMYSGGKDSTYMLDKFVNEYGKKVLSFTFDVPFESAHAAENITLARERIGADFVLDADDDNIKKMMAEVFNSYREKKQSEYLDEKMPCISCRTFFVLRAILHAHRNGIPYIALCADPQQILTMESDVREVVRGFYRTFGRAMTDDLFAGELQEILFTPDERLPKIVFPFVGMRYDYDPDTIVAELQAKGLYNSSPLETHCTLFPLLNYYSFRNHGCMFYKLNASSHLRSLRRNEHHTRSTFSIKFPQTTDVLDIEDRLRAVTLEIAERAGDPDAQERELVDLFQRLDASEDAARFVARSFLNMHTVADEVGIRL